MKAAVLTELNAPLTLADVECRPLEYGQVLVKVELSGICGAQLAEIRGEKGNAKHLPHLLGHEGAGKVMAVGVGVTRVNVADKVVMHWRKAGGIESPFPKYEFRGRIIESGRVTTFSQLAIVSENRITPVPQDTPNELCALLGCGLSSALGTIENDAALRFGETVLIIGCGGLGMNLIRAARLRGAGSIGVNDVRPEKGALALSMGADYFYSAPAGGDYDVIIDTAGDPQAMEMGLRSLAPSGRYIMVGQPRPGAAVTIDNAHHMFAGEGKVIRATQGGSFRPDQDIPRYLLLWRSGMLKLDGLVTHRVTLENINEGIDLVRNGHAGRVMVEML